MHIQVPEFPFRRQTSLKTGLILPTEVAGLPNEETA
jgi:hypothetical protein